jgi:hypothetical protein
MRIETSAARNLEILRFPQPTKFEPVVNLKTAKRRRIEFTVGN